MSETKIPANFTREDLLRDMDALAKRDAIPELDPSKEFMLEEYMARPVNEGIPENTIRMRLDQAIREGVLRKRTVRHPETGRRVNAYSFVEKEKDPH